MEQNKLIIDQSIDKKMQNLSGIQNMTTADIIVDTLIKWNVKLIFGIIGDGINPVIEALRKRQNEIRFITVRHEEAGAFMASGYAKLTGKIGACIGTSGPGFLHLVNGLYDAATDNVPVIAISGDTFRDLKHSFYPQDINSMDVVRDIAKINTRINGPIHAEYIMDEVCRSALGTSSLSHITIAKDTQNEKYSADNSMYKGKIIGTTTFTQNVIIPKREEFEKAAEILNAGNRITILIGRGAMNAPEEILQVAKILGAPIVKSLAARTIIDDKSEYTTGGIGHLGTKPSYLAMKECDTLLILGCVFFGLSYYPELGKAKCVQVDTNYQKIGIRYPATIGLVGDVKATLRQLIKHLNQKQNLDFLRVSFDRHAKWNAMLLQQEQDYSYPLKPQVAMGILNRYLTPDAIISLDTGSNTYFAAKHLKFQPQQRLLFSGTLQTMGCGLPFCIASKLVYPERQCLAIVGDGGFTMLMGEIATAVFYKIPIKVIIIKNNTLEWEMWEQKTSGFVPFGYELQPINFAMMATSCGAEGYTINRAEEIVNVYNQFFSSTNPAVLQINVDPNELPVKPEDVDINFV